MEHVSGLHRWSRVALGNFTVSWLLRGFILHVGVR